jgi:hypothetical protein
MAARPVYEAAWGTRRNEMSAVTIDQPGASEPSCTCLLDPVVCQIHLRHFSARGSAAGIFAQDGLRFCPTPI